METDLSAPFDAPARIRERQEKRRNEEASKAFRVWAESEEGRRIVREAYERATDRD